MKLLLIGNTIYLPLTTEGTLTKYMAGSISGTMFIDQILTKEEIYSRHSISEFPVTEHDNLHELCKWWGVRE